MNPFRFLAHRFRHEPAIVNEVFGPLAELNPELIHHLLTTQPERFLRRYRIMVGSGFRESGTYVGWLWLNDNWGAPYVVLSGGMPHATVATEAQALEFFYVQTDPCATVNPLALVGWHLPNPTSCGEDYILTSALSGCTLVFVGDADDGFPQMAHIQPYRRDDPINAAFPLPSGGELDADTNTIKRPGLCGVALQEQLNAAATKFTDQPLFDCKTFGRENYQRFARLNIIGVKSADRRSWIFYAQCFESADDTMPSDVIRFATLTYPAA